MLQIHKRWNLIGEENKQQRDKKEKAFIQIYKKWQKRK